MRPRTMRIQRQPLKISLDLSYPVDQFIADFNSGFNGEPVVRPRHKCKPRPGIPQAEN
jgi:hypothetical protein